MADERGAAAVEAESGARPGAGDETGAFGELLRRYRMARGLNQAGLAARAGLDRSYVNRIEAGERGAPTEAGTEALARALELSDPEADRLFAAAGLLPRSLRTLGAADPTILLLAQRLTDARLTPAARAALRATVETMARCWATPSGALAGQPAATAPTAGAPYTVPGGE